MENTLGSVPREKADLGMAKNQEEAGNSVRGRVENVGTWVGARNAQRRKRKNKGDLNCVDEKEDPLKQRKGHMGQRSQGKRVSML